MDAAPFRRSESPTELEVALNLPDPGARRTRRDLYEQLRTAIRTGRLAPGLRMPASRHLAQRLGVSRNTVTTVYDLLISEGCLASRPGSGTFVADDHPRQPGRPSAVDMTGRIRSAWRDWRPFDLPALQPRHFIVGAPDIAAFPWELWRRLANRTLRAFGRAPASHFALHGAPELRQGIAGHLSFARGVACRAEDIVITSGAQQAFDLLAKVLIHRPGVVVAVEDPGYAPARLPFAAAGAKVVATPVDDEGIVVEALPPDAEVIYVTPSHQFPLGVAMSVRRRHALLEFARRSGAVVIEDDYDGEFRYDGRPLEALQTLDVSGQVIYLGTFSKSLFPDLRLGFIVAPEWARGALLSAKQGSDGRSPLIAQHTLAAFIGEGHLARHVRRMRRIYGERRRALLEALAKDPARWLAPYPSAAGLHLAVRLPPEADARRVVGFAADLGVGVYPISMFAMDGRGHNGLVLGYGVLPEADVRAGAWTLVQCAQRAAEAAAAASRPGGRT
jgi:GntR family transcriptional regulator/MocR family aminotransferase